MSLTMEQTKTLDEPKVDVELAIQHGLTEEEYGMMLEILGRVPTYTELGIYSVMWSEHRVDAFGIAGENACSCAERT